MPEATCPQCKGAKVLPVRTEMKCPPCNGFGRIGPIGKKTTCSNCSGSGRYVKEEMRTCGKCWGRGTISY